MWPMKRKRECPNKPPEKKAKSTQIQTKLDLFSGKRSERGPPVGVFGGYEVRVACWNINGLRACVQKEDFLSFANTKEIDVLGLNKTKLQEANVPDIKPVLLTQFPYQYYACSQDRKGYSGVGILSKTKPLKVTYGLNQPDLDQEGRIVTAEFLRFRVVIVYTPSSGFGLRRLQYRIEQWDRAFAAYISELNRLGKPIIVMGDMNVVHSDLDVCERDKLVRDIPGTTQQERASFTRILGETLVDSFRYLHPNEVRFSWFKNESEWKNGTGWRLDYALVSAALLPKLLSADIYDKVRASDHHPIEVRLDNLWD